MPGSLGAYVQGEKDPSSGYFTRFRRVPYLSGKIEEQIDHPGSPNEVLSFKPLYTPCMEAGGRASGYVEQCLCMGPPSALRLEEANRRIDGEIGLVGKQRRKNTSQTALKYFHGLNMSRNSGQ